MLKAPQFLDFSRAQVFVSRDFMENPRVAPLILRQVTTSFSRRLKVAEILYGEGVSPKSVKGLKSFKCLPIKLSNSLIIGAN